MRNRNILQRSVDNLRTAPFGMSLGAVGVSGVVIVSIEGGVDLVDLPVIGLNVFSAVTAAKLVRRQFRLRHRLESSVEEHGFDTRVFSPTTKEWCNRQTARVVTRNAGCLDEYTELCEERSDTAELKSIPHF